MAGRVERRLRPAATPGYWRQHVHKESARNTGSPKAWSAYRGSRVTPVEGRDLSSRQTQYVVKDLEIGKPINSNKCSEAADGVARESVKSCPRAGCGKPACPVVCPVKAGMFSRRQTCRGRSQSPVVWIAEVMETETLKPIDKVSPGETTSHRAVTTVNALWPRK